MTLNIALIGYGKMGKAIERIARQRGHHIAAIIRRENKAQLSTLSPKNTHVAIEFTGPESAFDNIRQCLQQQVPVVSGSTGWLRHLPEVKQLIEKHQTPFFYAPNFSIGVNLFFLINRLTARLMSSQTQYEVSMEEVHHVHKKDAPSGTAIRLAEDILAHYPQKQGWALAAEAQAIHLPIEAKRIDEVPGIHIVRYRSTDDLIELKHEAFSRHGFAYGAVLAAEFLARQNSGFFGMEQLLEEQLGISFSSF
jgi:4-hydroxy-tetrahydrodipicolinate reductase